MEEERPVTLFVYDLSGGMASAYSRMILGSQIEAIWHTSVVVGGTEFYYGAGIQRAAAGTTPFGQPADRLSLGTTQVPDDLIDDYIGELGSSRFGLDQYRLMSNNCNNFSNELASFLTGSPIPSRYTDLPDRVLASPNGALIEPFLRYMEGQLAAMKQQGPGLAEAQGDASSRAANSGSVLAQAVLSGLNAARSVSQEAAYDGAGGAGVTEATRQEGGPVPSGGELEEARDGVIPTQEGAALEGVVSGSDEGAARALDEFEAQKAGLQEAIDLELAILLSQGWEYERAVVVAIQKASESVQQHEQAVQL